MIPVINFLPDRLPCRNKQRKYKSPTKKLIMKKSTVLIAILLLPALAMAQTGNIDQLMNKYGGQEGVTVVNISPQLFQVMSELDVQEFSGQDFPLDKLSAVKIITIENSTLLTGTNFYDEVTSDLDLT